MHPRRPRIHRAAIALLATVSLAGGALALAPSASAAASPGTVTDASFTWGLSGEAGGGAFFGGCNFLSAGTAGDTGSSRLWTEADGFYAQEAGNVSIVKPDASGALVPTSWGTKCQTAAGTPVNPASTASLTRNAVLVDGGTGTVAADGSTRIEWDGSFTVAFYGGLTYWTATDPVLSVDGAGNGTLTATASGYGTDMADQTKWVPVAPQQVVLADIRGAAADDDSLTAAPDYLGVAVTTAGTAQSRTGASWGSFPQSFIDFQAKTGQSSYWYSSGGSRDAAKPASPLSVAYTLTGATTPEPTTPPTTPPTEPGEQDITVQVPAVTAPPATGSFGWAFESTDAVSLGTAVQAGSTFVANGALNTIAVTDTRSGGSTPYGWSIAGSVSGFTSAAGGFDAGYLGWTPSVAGAGPAVAAGAAVGSTLENGAGLAEPATLASSTAAASASVDAAVKLVIPTTTPAGDYAATLTITALG
ncbi:hypothetical protein C5C27_10110 [Rathayibacter sp. AY2B7]|uniref:hypothetical protein n=1 Tax=Rathayibacter sp. AY2B7 TaxID=2080571 RepID=UPI000CE742BC|nr:hypothetical protein [Rathayibacter sp. AY2B7]PPG59050.1 hypothetical protein C5C27_10110 [Rathayibacter sp. AY2B7]